MVELAGQCIKEEGQLGDPFISRVCLQGFVVNFIGVVDCMDDTMKNIPSVSHFVRRIIGNMFLQRIVILRLPQYEILVRNGWSGRRPQS